MALSEANRARYRDMVQAMVPDGEVVDYAVGRAGPDPVIVGSVLALVFVASAIAFYAITGGYFFLGFAVVVVIQFFVSPPRGVAITHTGATLIKRSFWTGRPSSAKETVPHGAVEPAAASGTRIKVAIGDTDVWCTKTEEGHIRTALARIRRGVAGPGPAPMTPLPEGLPDGAQPSAGPAGSTGAGGGRVDGSGNEERPTLD